MDRVWHLQKKWYIILLGFALGGVLLIYFNWIVPDWVQRMSSAVKSDAWSRLIGIYLLSAVFTHLLIFFSYQGIDVLLKFKCRNTVEDLWAPTLVGLCESFLYPTALIMNHAGFIPLWLGIKVAVRWTGWVGIKGADDLNKQTEKTDHYKARRLYNKFLVGNAFSIAAAVITYFILRSFVLNH